VGPTKSFRGRSFRRGGLELGKQMHLKNKGGTYNCKAFVEGAKNSDSRESRRKKPVHRGLRGRLAKLRGVQGRGGGWLRGARTASQKRGFRRADERPFYDGVTEKKKKKFKSPSEKNVHQLGILRRCKGKKRVISSWVWNSRRAKLRWSESSKGKGEPKRKSMGYTCRGSIVREWGKNSSSYEEIGKREW